MAAAIPTTTSYANRQVDVELLQSIRTPDVSQQVSLSNVKKTPKLVAGIEKMAQRYTNLLLSFQGSTHFDQANGTNFLSQLLGGVQNLGALQSVFAAANAAVLTQMTTDDARIAYGTLPSDERILNAVLLDSNIDIGTSTAYLRIQLTSLAGDTFVFVIPSTSAR